MNIGKAASTEVAASLDDISLMHFCLALASPI